MNEWKQTASLSALSSSATLSARLPSSKPSSTASSLARSPSPLSESAVRDKYFFYSNLNEFYADFCDNTTQRNVNAKKLDVVIAMAANQWEMVNINLIAAQFQLPTIGLVTQYDRTNYKRINPHYASLNASPRQDAEVVLRVLEHLGWFSVSLIVESKYEDDGFIGTFRQVVRRNSLFHMDDLLLVSANTNSLDLYADFSELRDNRGRINVVYISTDYFQNVFQRVLLNYDFLSKGWIWFFVGPLVYATSYQIHSPIYPMGFITVKNRELAPVGVLVDDLMRFTRNASVVQQRQQRGGSGGGGGREQGGGVELYDSMLRFWTERIAFDRYGVMTNWNYTISNLISRDGVLSWDEVGEVKDSVVEMNAPIWPTNSSAMSSADSRVIRVVTAPAAPFVIIRDPVDEENPECFADELCTQVNTHVPERIIAILDQIQAGENMTGPDFQVKCCSGFALEMLQVLSKDAGISYQLYIVDDLRFGIRGDNGSWDGLVRDILSGAAHAAVSAFSVTAQRSRAIDFTVPFFSSDFSMMVGKRDAQTPLFSFLKPFSATLWVLIFCSALVMAVAAALLEWGSPFGLTPRGRKRAKNHTLGSAVTIVFSTIFQHNMPSKSPKSWPGKWFQNFIGAFAFVFFGSYTAKLAAYLTLQESVIKISNIHDPELFRVNVGTFVSSSTLTYLNSSPKLIPLARHVEKNLVKSLDAAAEAIRSGSLDAFLFDTPIIDFLRARDPECTLQVVGKTFGEEGYSIGLYKGSSLQSTSSHLILKYHDSGFLEQLQRKWFGQLKCSKPLRDFSKQQLGLEHFGGISLFLVFGMFAAIMTLCLEHVIYTSLIPWIRKQPNNSRWKSVWLMFFSQRIYRIVHSKEMVGVRENAKEIVDMVRNRDFMALLQKSQRKRRRKYNFDNVVFQAKCKAQDSSDTPLQASEYSDSVNPKELASPECISMETLSSCHGPSETTAQSPCSTTLSHEAPQASGGSMLAVPRSSVYNVWSAASRQHSPNAGPDFVDTVIADEVALGRKSKDELMAIWQQTERSLRDEVIRLKSERDLLKKTLQAMNAEQ